MSITASAEAQATGLPQKVPPMVPAGAASMISALAVIAEIGRPAPRDLAVVMISGAAPTSAQYSDA